jgi:predicted PurR-regulated permease PerM
MLQPVTLPFYAKVCLNLITLSLLAIMLYLGQGILVPFFFSILLATLLLPVVNLLVRWMMPKVFAILLSIVISLAVIGVVIYFLSRQISVFLEDIETIKQRLQALASDFQEWINKKFNISESAQDKYIEDTAEDIKQSGAGIVGRTFSTITESLSYLVFLPVYTFLILFYKDLIKKFFISVFNGSDEGLVGGVLYQARTIGRDYILGLFIDMTIVFTLNTIGFDPGH